LSDKENDKNIADSVVDPKYLENLKYKIYNVPFYLRRISRAFVVLISLLFFIGAIFSSWVALIKLKETILPFSSLDVWDKILEEDSVPKFINLAEYLMVPVTFFAISIGLASFSHPKSKEQGYEKWADISEFEKYIFGMVIATISLAFLSGVLKTINVISPAPDMILKVGIGIGAVIISLGVYIILSTRK